MRKLNSDIGEEFELLARKILPGAKSANLENRNLNHDLHYDGYRVDVKAEKLSLDPRNSTPRFTFNLHECFMNCDFFLLIGYIETITGNEALIAWFIPSALVQKRYITIGLRNLGRFKDYTIDIPGLTQAKQRRLQKLVDTAITKNKRRKLA